MKSHQLSAFGQHKLRIIIIELPVTNFVRLRGMSGHRSMISDWDRLANILGKFGIVAAVGALMVLADDWLCGAARHFSLMPQAANRSASLDHLVGATEQRQRHCEAERLGGLKIDEQLDFRRLLDWQIDWLLALENPADLNADVAV